MIILFFCKEVHLISVMLRFMCCLQWVLILSVNYTI
jgi:hypothetical protein